MERASFEKKMLNEEQQTAVDAFTGDYRAGKADDVSTIWCYRQWKNGSLYGNDTGSFTGEQTSYYADS